MNTTIDVNLHVNLELSNDLKTFLTALLGAVSPSEKNETKSVEDKPVEPENNTTKSETEQQSTEKQEPVAAEVEKTTEKNNVGASEELTSSDVRHAIDETRKRIEGDDYETNLDGENRKKYHKQLTSMFKTISLGVDPECPKPSSLDTTDKIRSFINACNEIYIADDDSLKIAVPF